MKKEENKMKRLTMISRKALSRGKGRYFNEVEELKRANSFNIATQAFLLLTVVRFELSLLDSAKLLLFEK